MLTKRQEEILRLIIQNYTITGQPIGSKKLMEEGVKASSATIRNDMKDLEASGLLMKTHSSSGRIPSIIGYRYYVDHLLSPLDISDRETAWIRHSFEDEFHEIDDIIQRSATMLSQLTSYTAIMLGPDVNDRKLTGFRVIPLNRRQVIAIVVTDKGNVESKVFSIPSYLESEDLETIVRIINDKLIGESLITVYHRLRTEIPMILHKYFQSTEGILDLFDLMLSNIFQEKIFVGGRMNILNFDQQRDVEELKSMYSLMKNGDQLNQLLNPHEAGFQIKIGGTELGNKLLDNMSLIQSGYEIKGHGTGSIALLGPTSMSYSRMVGLIGVLQKELEETLAGYYRSLDSIS